MSDPETQQRIAECGKAMAIACPKALNIEGSVHLPTMVAGCARMSGSYLLRSFKRDLSAVPPGESVLSPQGSEGSALLLRFCASILQTFGAAPAEPQPGIVEEQRRGFKQTFLEAQQALEPVFAPLQRQYGLDDEQAAKAAALATAVLIHHFARYMDPAAGFGSAAYGFTEGAETAPLRLSSA